MVADPNLAFPDPLDPDPTPPFEATNLDLNFVMKKIKFGEKRI